MKKILAIVLLGFSSVYAQTVDAVTTTPNLITSGTSHTWTGVQTGAIPANYMPGGPTPKYDPSTNTFQFSYGQATVSQTIAINNALSNVGAGVQINGYQYSYQLRNMNGDDRQTNVDTITINTAMKNSAGVTLLSGTEVFNTKFDWTNVSGVRTATTPYALSDVSTLSFSATSKDTGFWGGYFGPQVRNVDMRLNYTVDPCATNPRYSPTCAGYNDVTTSGNLTNIYGTTFAINQALGYGNAGVRVHSTTWGYDYTIGGQRCVWDILGLCMQWTDSSVGGSMAVYDTAGQTVASDSNTHSGQNIVGSFRREVLLGATSRDISTLGNASINTWAMGNAAVSPHLSFTFSPDICRTDPLVNPGCPGYADAYLNLQCSSNPLYNQSCPGYAAALFTQQCSANPLYDVTCPGYANAYLSYQCSINPLYSTTCVGYEAAYFNQQCSLNPLYNTRCSGYESAYLTQQCNINPLYSTSCSGYASAYFTQQCNANSLYSVDCPGYASAYLNQQCSLNQLYSTQCAGYQTAYKAQQCSLNQLYSTDCPGYQTAYFNQQCSLNVLYNSSCPGYEQAYFNQQCSLNPLYNAQCSGYTQAYHDQQCRANPLYASDCLGYDVAYKNQQCSLSSLYATDCPGYAEAYKTQQCSINALFATDCPGYAEAYKASMCASNPLYANDCPGYAKAYALKNVINVSPTVMAAVQTIDSASTSNTSNTSNTVAAVSDPIVNQTLAPTTTSVSPASSATATVPLVQSNTTSSAGVSNVTTSSVSTSTVAAPPPADTKPSAPTARQELQAKREAAAKAKAVEEGKNLASNMGKAANMEAQKQIQNVVIAAMGFTPGFDGYGKANVPDGRGYKPFTVYNNQTNVDNARLGRRMYGPSDSLHDELVQSQWDLK